MSYARGEHPNSQANLDGHGFQPGYDARRGHRPNGGLAYLEWFNAFTASVDAGGEWRYSRSQMEQFAAGDDGKATPMKVAAAKAALHFLDANGFDKLDRMPKWATFLQHSLDHTVGKPVQRVHVDGQVTHEHVQGYDDFVDYLVREPERADRLEAALKAARRRIAAMESDPQLQPPTLPPGG